FALRSASSGSARSCINDHGVCLVGCHAGILSHRSRRRPAMRFLVVGCSFHSTPIEIREKLAFDEAVLPRALEELGSRFDCEAALLSTCNRVEIYLARPAGSAMPDADLLAEFMAEFHRLSAAEIRPHLYELWDDKAFSHLFRVSASLDSMIVGEGQIAGQVKRAYEIATACSS